MSTIWTSEVFFSSVVFALGRGAALVKSVRFLALVLVSNSFSSVVLFFVALSFFFLHTSQRRSPEIERRNSSSVCCSWLLFAAKKRLNDPCSLLQTLPKKISLFCFYQKLFLSEVFSVSWLTTKGTKNKSEEGHLCMGQIPKEYLFTTPGCSPLVSGRNLTSPAR